MRPVAAHAWAAISSWHHPRSASRSVRFKTEAASLPLKKSAVHTMPLMTSARKRAEDHQDRSQQPECQEKEVRHDGRPETDP
jgi:hypothetical protein